VGRNAFDDQEVALELLDYLKPSYPQLLEARYGLKEWQALESEALLEAVGRSRGALAAGGKVNMQKAAELLIHDFRSGALGRITLETPEEYARWLAEGKKLDAERQLRKEELAREGHIRAPRTPKPAAKKAAPRPQRRTR
jgi:ribosome biogenesis GTPase A